MDPIRSCFKILLTEEELQLPAIDELTNKYLEWLRLSKETTRQRKTRAANRRADQIYDEIMEVKHLPRIELKFETTPPQNNVKLVTQTNDRSSKSSIDDDSSGFGSSCGRTLRSRTRTPSLTRDNTSKPQSCPSTPIQQNLRSHMKKNAHVLTAALNQEHPSVSLTKIRQLMRADSAQKKQVEEKERQEKMRIDRKAKEERAEQQKKQMLEERAITAKMKREQRLLHAAEVRKAREKAKQDQKLKEEQAKKNLKTYDITNQKIQIEVVPSAPPLIVEEPVKPVVEVAEKQQQQHQTQQIPQPPPPQPQQEPVKKINETFQNDNIDISIQDETHEENKSAKTQVASWAKAPYFREAVIKQYSMPEEELLQLARSIFLRVELPVELDKIFGKSSVNNRYLHRTSSAVWHSPARGLKRTSSMVMTPTNPKR